VHRSEHRHRRRHRGHHGSHRHRRHHRDDRRRHRVHHGLRRVHHVRRRVHRDRWDEPNGPASHPGWGEGACYRGWDGVRPDRVPDEDRPDPEPVGHRRHLHLRRGRDAGPRLGGVRRHPVRDAKRGVRPVLHSNRGCCRRAGHAGRASVHRDAAPEPDVPGVSRPGLLRPGLLAQREPGCSWEQPVSVHSAPGRSRRASTGPEPAQRGAGPGSELPSVRAWAVHRAWHRWTVLPEHLHCWWIPVRGGLRPVLPVMVYRPGRCLRRLLTALRCYRWGRPVLGRTGEVAGPRGPQRSTTQILRTRLAH